ncbi:MAG: hypothetical protein ABIN18_27335 [Pseudomonadota bacterium]
MTHLFVRRGGGRARAEDSKQKSEVRERAEDSKQETGNRKQQTEGEGQREEQRGKSKE